MLSFSNFHFIIIPLFYSIYIRCICCHAGVTELSGSCKLFEQLFSILTTVLYTLEEAAASTKTYLRVIEIGNVGTRVDVRPHEGSHQTNRRRWWRLLRTLGLRWQPTASTLQTRCSHDCRGNTIRWSGHDGHMVV